MKIVISVKDPTPNTINTKLTSKKSNEALGHLTFDIFFLKKKPFTHLTFQAVRGVFVILPRGVLRAITTWTWVFKRGSRTQNSTEGPKLTQWLVGHFPKIFKSQDHKSPKKIRIRTRRLIKAMLSIRSPKNSCWAEPLTVPWLDQT